MILPQAEAADEVLRDFSEWRFIDAKVLGTLASLVNRMVEVNRLGTVRIIEADRSSRIFESSRWQRACSIVGIRGRVSRFHHPVD
jgi:hypothetical protein